MADTYKSPANIYSKANLMLRLLGYGSSALFAQDDFAKGYTLLREYLAEKLAYRFRI